MKHKTSDVIVPTSAEYDAFVTRMSRVFIAAAFFVMMSQNLLAPNLTAAAASFGLTAQERDTIMGGWMSTAFFLVGGPCSLVRRWGCADWGAFAAEQGDCFHAESTAPLLVFPRPSCPVPALPRPSPRVGFPRGNVRMKCYYMYRVRVCLPLHPAVAGGGLPGGRLQSQAAVPVRHGHGQRRHW